MNEMKIDPKLEAIRTSATEFVSHEKKTITDYGERILKDVEVLINDSVSSASHRLNSVIRRVEEVVKTEPLVAFAALAITGIAVANVISRRYGRRARSAASAKSAAAAAESEQTIH